MAIRVLIGRGLVALACAALAAQASENQAPEPWPEQVRALIEAKHHGAAEAALRARLVEAPEDFDARVLLGTVLSWQGSYADARQQLEKVLSVHPTHGDALRAAIRVELWSGHPERAAELASRGLAKEPGNRELRIELARAKQLCESAAAAQRLWEAALGVSYDSFDDGRLDWNELALQLSRRTAFGSLLARGGRASHFGKIGHQLELEGYPKLRPGTYADLAFAFGDGAIYPRYRAVAELFQAIGYGFELSLGYRHLFFSESVHIGSASVGKYFGPWLFSVRTFVTPSARGASYSFHGSARRYLFGGSSYCALRYGWGGAREEVRTLQDLAITTANSVGAEAYFAWRRFGVRVRGGYAREQRSLSALQQLTLGADARVSF